VILTLDLGSSITKVALWGPDGLVGWAGCPVGTVHPLPGRSEQDPGEWWTSLVSACQEMRAREPEAFTAVDVVGCTGARQTMAVVDAEGQALGPAILWSDRRAGDEARRMAGGPGGEGSAAPPSGIALDAASVAAKLEWLRTHRPECLAAGAWVLTPRDLVAWWLTGVVATDPTMASRSGLYDLDGGLDAALVGDSAALLPPVAPSDRVTGSLTPAAAAALGLTGGTPVVIGAGDRASEVVGTGATESRPMVSWGTTANVSVPLTHRPSLVPGGVVLSRGAAGGWLLEGGLSAAGSLLAWIGHLTGHPTEVLARWAGQSPPGARGVVATPWLEGARAPWWREDATVGFVGLDPVHGPGDLARAAYEAVAWEVQRCLEVIGRRRPEGPAVSGLALGGSGATIAVWTDVVTAVTGLPADSRRSGQAASAGAAVLAARAIGVEMDLGGLDPVDGRIAPDPETVRTYRTLRDGSDRLVSALLELSGPTRPESAGPGVEGSPCG
jgi:sugar (pentulose or hexulose) kinase